jgi:hypothetical protein
MKKSDADRNGAAATEPPRSQDLSNLSFSDLHEALAKTDDFIGEAERHGPESESLKVDLHASRAEIFRELERRWAQIPVDKEYHTEPEQVEFPQAAWSEKIFRDFREGIVPWTEAAPEKLWSALLVAAGLMLVPQRPARKSQAHLRKFLHAAGRRDGRRAEEHRFVDHCRTSSPRR